MPEDNPLDSTQDDATGGVDDVTASDGVPDFRAARRHVLIELLRLATQLRQEGVEVPASATLSAGRALAVVGLSDRDAVAAALRATLLSTAPDIEAFESAFPTFWHRLRSGLDAVGTDHDGPTPGDDDADAGDDSAADDAETAGVLEDAEVPDLDGDGDGEVEVRIPTERQHATGDRPTNTGEGDARRYSAVGERERVEAETATLTADELAAIDRFVASLSTLPGRRRKQSTAGDRIEAQRALRASLKTGGAPVDLPKSEPVADGLRCCLLVDVSGSVLDIVDRSVLLAFAAHLQGAARDGSVFLFDTELMEATEAFASADGDPAGVLRDAEVQWGGGTKIGDALVSLRQGHPYAVDRRTVVVVVSDGLDVGDPDVLADGITWLSDQAGAVVWLNPLAVSPSFKPESRGMSIADPYLDALFGFAEPADLDEAARQLEQRGLDGQVGYEHDRRQLDAQSGDVP